MKPVLFTLPGTGWEIGAYGFFVAVALVVAWAQTLRLSRAEGHNPAALGPVFVGSAVAGLLGARMAWLLQHPPAYEGMRSLITLRAGTLAPFAGVVVAMVVGGAWASRLKVRPWAWYDILAPALAIGMIFERVGAFLAGTAYGRYAPDAALALRFPTGSPAFSEHQRTLANLMRAGAAQSLPVHPVQLYAAVLGLLGLVLCLWVRKRRRFEGQVFLSFGLYALAVRAFVEEPLRADAPAAALGPLNAGQVGAAVMMVVLGVVYAAKSRRAGARAKTRARSADATTPRKKPRKR